MSTRNRGLVRSLVAGGLLSAAWLLLGPTTAHAADRSIDLYAVTGTTSFNGASATVWGYSTTNAAVTAPGGPVITVAEGDTVTIHLHNTLAERTSLYVGGQAMVPDTTGAPKSTLDTDGNPVLGEATYTFTASRPGTYLYEAGLTANQTGLTANNEHQVAMGLYGAFVVRATTPTQAYDDATTAFDTDAVLVLSQFDPAMSANPAAFDMRNFKPRYSLVNGKVHPETSLVPATVGQKVLLRYVNAGVDYRSMAVLGASQRLIGLDGSQLKNGTTDASRSYVAETFGPGQTADAIVTAPQTNGKVPVYDASLALHNSSASGLGGMLTAIDVTGEVAGADTSGPATTGVAWAAGTLTATVSDVATGNGNVTAAEYRLDSVTAGATAMTGSFGSPTVVVTANDVAIVSGEHVLYVRGKDGNDNWGPWSSVLVMGADGQGPTTSGVTLAPERTNGSVDVAVSATANDSASGGTAIGGAELSIDGGAAMPMTLATNGSVASVTGTIPASTINSLSEGSHVVSVRARDASGNWGDPATAALVVDETGPVASALTVEPDPNNGLIPVNSSTPSVRLSATLTDNPSTVGAAQSNVVKAEGFVDTLGPVGSGIPLEASDGAWSSPMEHVYLDIPLATVRQMTEGAHHLYVRGKDAAGNWGAATYVDLHIDKSGPAISDLAIAPNPTNGARTATLTATIGSDISGVGRVEWFLGADPGVGNATAVTVPSTGGPISVPVSLANVEDGDYQVTVRTVDGLGNRASATTTLHHTPVLWFSTTGSTAPATALSNPDDADIYTYWNAAARFGRSVDATAAPYGLPSGANVDGFSRADKAHFYLSFTAQVNVPGLGNVEDEDVVYFNNGTWQLFFDGSLRGLTSTAFDLDAISVVGGTLYFSTDNANVPSGAGGTGDDADIYRWNTGSSYTRVVDATGTTGFSTNASSTPNVDGFVWRSSSDWFMSFSTDATIGALSVQDEDVVHRTSGTWSTYFDGTSAGLTNNNLDVDAFDIP